MIGCYMRLPEKENINGLLIQPGMLYRQHSNNQVGANASLLGAIKRIKKLKILGIEMR